MSQAKKHSIPELSKQSKLAFLTVVVLGLLVHMYKFTNTLPNYDSVFNYYNHQNIVQSGRWFLMFACAPSSFFDLPWLIGVFVLLYIGLTAVIAVDLFALQKPVSVILAAGVLVTFPAVTETLFFEYTADGYMLAMLMAAGAAWLTAMERGKWYHFLLAGILLILCCATYQAYISFALMLTLCCGVKELLTKRHSTRSVLLWGAKHIALYAVSLGLYFLIWRIAMRLMHTSAYAYQGISSVGSLELSTILFGLKSSLRSFFSFFLGELMLLHRPSVYEMLGAAFLAVFSLYFLWIILRKARLWKTPGALCLVVVLFLLIPFVCHIWYFTSKEVEYDTRLLQSLSVLFLLLIWATEAFSFRWSRRVAAALLTVMVFHFSVQANICYFFLQQCKETTNATAVEMLTRTHMEQTEETEYFVIIGTNKDLLRLDSGRGSSTAREIRNLSGTLSKNLFAEYKLAYLYLWNDLGMSLGEIWDASEQNEIAQRPEVREMPCWPLPGSVKAIDNLVVIKLSDVSEP